jgi:hypothetical protein
MIREYALTRGFHPKTLERWLSWEAPDRNALKALVLHLKISENHLRELMDWLEELHSRDGAAIGSILAGPIIESITTDPRLGRADKLKRIKEQLRRLRFPRLTRIEDEIRTKIMALKLASGITVTVPAGLEGGKLQVEFSAGTSEEFAVLAAQLTHVAAREETRTIFQLLSGRRPDETSVDRIQSDEPV